jgi:5-formyltetrahydrofolate cyclo-ligase
MTADPKAALRTRLRSRRREISVSRDREADAERLAEHVLRLVRSRPDAGPVCRVAAYVALPTEPPTHRLIEALERAGCEVILPVLLPDRSLDWTLHAAGSGLAAPGTVDGLLLGPDAISTADLILTPGLAVDQWGNRLGQGGGSYDRALPLRRRDALVVTVLHDGEMREDPLPHERHDLPVDAVLTVEGGYVSCRASG